MKFYNIIFSPTGGVKKAADIVVRELSEDFATVDLTAFGADFSIYNLQNDDVAIISIPSFGGRAPKIAIERLKQIKSDNAKAILICVYGNRAYEDALVELQDAVEESGFNVIAVISAVAEHSIVRRYGANRPDDKDEEQLKGFALKIKDRICAPESFKPEIPGNRPYKEFKNAGLIPETTKNCINCKKCADLCPAGAISKTDVKNIDKNKCITCTRCIKICPHQAKRLNKIVIETLSLMLKKACSKRKTNELF